MAEVTNTPYANVVNPTSATLTSGMTSSEASQILAQLGINVNDVLSSSNIAQTTSGATPAVDDLLGIRAGLMESTGTNAAYATYQQAMAAAQKASQGLSTGLQQLSNRPVSLSKITGTQAQLREVASNEIQTLQDAANLALQTYQAKKGEAEAQFGIREAEISQKRTLQAQYPGAGIKLTDSFDGAIKKISKYQEDVAKKEYKDKLKGIALELGIKTKGLSKGELERKIAKKNKAALEQAKQAADLDLEYKKAQIANLGKKGSGTSEDDKEEKEFYSDVDKMRTQMYDEKANWSYAWNYLNNKYPGLSPNAIDNALGLDYRTNYDK
jgi:hypothetical protein